MDDARIEAAADQTAAAAARMALEPAEAVAESDEREILRRLAERVAALGRSAATAEKRALWSAHNSLGRTRPLIYCDPENGWNEIITAADLGCRGKLARSWEMHLRREIFYGERMGDDKPVEPVFNVAWVTSADDWGLNEEYTKTEDSGSYVWKGPLADYARDLPRLHEPRFAVDRDTTAACLDLAGRIFGGVLDVRLKGTWWWSMGLTYPAARFRGLDQLFYDFIDHPDELKALLAAISRGYLAKLDRLEAEGLLSPNWDGTYVGSGGLGYTTELPGPGFQGQGAVERPLGFHREPGDREHLARDVRGVHLPERAADHGALRLDLLRLLRARARALARHQAPPQPAPGIRFTLGGRGEDGGLAAGSVHPLAEAEPRGPCHTRDPPRRHPRGPAADLRDHPRLRGRGDHEGQPHDRPQPAERDRLVPHRPRGSRARGAARPEPPPRVVPVASRIAGSSLSADGSRSGGGRTYKGA